MEVKGRKSHLRYAFMRQIEGGQWCVAIVGNVVNRRGELVDARFLPTEEAALAWCQEMIGDSECVYAAPKEADNDHE